MKLEWNGGGWDAREITVDGMGIDLLKHILYAYMNNKIFK